MTRLDPVEAMSEADLQRHVLLIAAQSGWHVSKREWDRRAAEVAGFGLPPEELPGIAFHPRFSVGSETGWPDLVLVRRRDRRLIFAELKREVGKLSPRQELVLDLLRALVDPDDGTRDRIHVFVWRPSDLESGAIEAALQ